MEDHIKAFNAATADKVWRVQFGNPTASSIILVEKIVSDWDHVDQAIAENFKKVYEGEYLQSVTSWCGPT